MNLLLRRIKTVQTFLRQRRAALDFRDVRDPRRRRGRRWSAQTLLSTATLGLLLQAKSLRATERSSEDRAGVRRVRGLHRRLPDSTLGDFLSRVSPMQLRHHLHQMVLAEHRRKALEPLVLPIRAIAIDGKTLATLDEKRNTACQKHSPDGRDP